MIKHSKLVIRFIIFLIFRKKKKENILIKKNKINDDLGKDIRICPNCDKSIPYDSGFCPYCTMKFR